jgi:hypothetical protein
MKKKQRRNVSKSKSRKSKKLAKDFLQVAIGDQIIVSKNSNVLIK